MSSFHYKIRTLILTVEREKLLTLSTQTEPPNLLVLREELRIHEGRPAEEEVLEVVCDLAPVGQLERLHRRVLHVHVRVHPVAHQRLHDGVLRRPEVVVGPKL